MTTVEDDELTTPLPVVGPTLRERAVRGLRVASMAAAGKTAVDLGAQLVLLGLLAPEHFGVFAVALALSGFVSCLSDMAGTRFLIRRATCDRRTFSTVFWTELTLGVVVAGAWATACVPLLEALGKPEQVSFAQVLGLWIVAERLLLPRVWLEREMRFGAVNGALFGGVLVGSTTLIVTALMGLGPWVFVCGLIARTLASGALMWSLARVLPRLEFDTAIVRELAFFGAPLMIATTLTFAYTNVDYLIVHAVAGYTMVGLYYAAYRYPHYLNQFNVVLSSVVFPTFSRAIDDAQLVRGLRLLTRYAALAMFLPVVAMWLEGEAILRWVIGEKWLAALFPFQCFTTLAALRVVFVHWNQVYVVRGRTRPVMVTSAVNLPLIVVATYVGVTQAGIEGAALGVTLVSLTTLFGACAWLMPRALPAFRYGEALRPAMVAALVALSAGVVLGALLPNGAVVSAVRLAMVGVLYAAVAWRLVGAEAREVFRG